MKTPWARLNDAIVEVIAEIENTHDLNSSGSGTSATVSGLAGYELIDAYHAYVSDEAKKLLAARDLCPLCGEDRNHPSQHGKHRC